MLMVSYHPRACALGCSAPLLRGLRPGLCYIAPAGLIDNSPSFDPPCWTSKSARSKHLGLILQSYQFLKGKILPNPFGEVFQADLFGGAPKARCRTAQGGAKRNPGYQASIDISPARAAQKNYRIPNRHIISNSVSPLQGSMLMVLYHPRACALGCSAPPLRGFCALGFSTLRGLRLGLFCIAGLAPKNGKANGENVQNCPKCRLCPAASLKLTMILFRLASLIE